jgi:hypothetical protein
MIDLRRLQTALAASLLFVTPVLATIATTGCGAGGGDAKLANVKAGELPHGETWKGVFYSELYGNLHLVPTGSKVVGKWERPHKEKYGKLKGTIDGDVLHFEWTEHLNGVVGPNSERTGHGYFKFKVAVETNGEPSIIGEIGKGGDEVGSPWDAIRQKNIEPDLSSIGGSGAGDVGGGDWDGENKEKGTPEAPASPPAP